MTIRRANKIAKTVAEMMPSLYKRHRKKEDLGAAAADIERAIADLGFSYRRQEVFFLPEDKKEYGLAFVLLDYIIEDNVLLRTVKRPHNDPLEYRLLYTLMNLSSTKAAVRVNFGAPKVEDAIIFCDINTARMEMLPPDY